MIIQKTANHLHRHYSAGWNPVEIQIFVSNLNVQIYALGFNATRLFDYYYVS